MIYLKGVLMTDYLIVRVGGEELEVPYGYLTPNAPVEVDIRDGCPIVHEGIYVVSIPLDDFRPAYEEWAGSEGSHLDLGDMPHTSVVEPKTKIETPSNYLIDMFLGHGEAMVDTARFATSEELPNKYSKEDILVRLLIDSRLRPEQVKGIKAKVFTEKRTVGWSDAVLYGLEVDGFKIATSPDFEQPQYLHYIGPDGEEGYGKVAPELRKMLRRLAKVE
jgi:hypothetical protein